MAVIANNKAEKYISGVIDGSIIASKLVRLACERHRKDLKDGHERNLSFSPKHGQHVIDFIQKFCHHSQGEWSGQPFKLAPWQQALLWITYGWRWKDTGYRRFKYLFVCLARGNGKSFLASALGIYELIASNEPGAEVYSVATKKDQARIVFAEAERMVAASPDLKKRIKSYRDSLFIPSGNGAKFQPLSSDEDSLDGLRPQCIIADEIHAWSSKARKLWDVLVSALGKRRSPIYIAITTAGQGEESLCRQQDRYSEKVLSGVPRPGSPPLRLQVAVLGQGAHRAQSRQAEAEEEVNPERGEPVLRAPARRYPMSRKEKRSMAGANRSRQVCLPQAAENILRVCL